MNNPNFEKFRSSFPFFCWFIVGNMCLNVEIFNLSSDFVVMIL